MSTQVNSIGDRLQNRLDTIEEQIKSTRSRVVAATEQGERALRDKVDEAHDAIQARKQRVEQALANLKARAQQKVTATKEEIADWKAKREVRKLNNRADRAESYAADAIDFALAALDEADAAVLDAVVARLDADAVQ
jgi:hypothetical protein